jgi:hypothetical protein
MKTRGKDWEMDDRVADEHIDAFAKLCSKAAERYPDITYFQVWNEFKGYWDHKRNRWDVEKYTDHYNKIYKAVKAVRPDAKIGGFYMVLTEAIVTGGTLSKKDWKLINYWLKHKAGADFFCFDGNLRRWKNRKQSRPLEVVMSRAPGFGKVAAQLKTKTDLPIWVSEYYGAQKDTGNPQYEAANHASAYYHSLINGTTVALHWDPVGFCPLFTKTDTADGGKPTPHYAVVKAFNTHFGPGTQLVKATSSTPDIEVLATAKKTLLINKRNTVISFGLNGQQDTLEAYEVRLVDTPRRRGVNPSR